MIGFGGKGSGRLLRSSRFLRLLRSSQLWGFYATALLLAIPLAQAGSFDFLRVDHIRTPAYGVSGYYPIRVEVANEGDLVAEDVHVRSWMPTFSDRANGQINEITGFNKGRWLLQDVPTSTESGEYWVRVTISNDDERRVKHRLVFVNNQQPEYVSVPSGDRESTYVQYRTEKTPPHQFSSGPSAQYVY